MSRKLHYFDVNGIAESIRYLLHYGGHKFEDVRYNHATWPDKRIKDGLPYGQLPLYEEGNKSLNQSIAIARYIAHQVKLMPTDLWEQAFLDSIVYTIYDFWNFKMLPYIKETDPVRKAELKKEIIHEHVDFFFSRFEKTLKDHNGFFNGKLSWADFVFVAIVEATNLFLGCQIETKYPTVKALLLKFYSLPGVKEYIAKRKPYEYVA